MFRKALAFLMAAMIVTAVFAGCARTELSPAGRVTAKAGGTHSITVSWDAAENATAYEATAVPVNVPAETSDSDTGEAEASDSDTGDAEASDSAAGETVFAAGDLDGTEYTFEGLAIDTEYEITVVAVDKSKTEARKSAPAVVSGRTDSVEINAPAEVAAAADSDTQITVTWEAAAVPEGEDGAIAYTVKAADDETGANETIIAEKIAETSFAQEGLPENTEKYYTVYAVVTIDEKDFVSDGSAFATAVTMETAVLEEEAAAAAKAETAAKQGGGGNTSASSAREAAAWAEAQRVVGRIITEGMSDWDKANAICNYMVNNVAPQYDQSLEAYKTNFGNEAYAALISHIAACSGVCKAVTMMCNIVGLQSQHINAGQWTHQWNLVLIDGEWLRLDGQAWMQKPNEPVGTSEIIKCGCGEEFPTMEALEAHQAYYKDLLNRAEAGEFDDIAPRDADGKPDYSQWVADDYAHWGYTIDYATMVYY
jgi:hypothetical protein